MALVHFCPTHPCPYCYPKGPAMNDAAVRQIAQSDPVPAMTARWGQVVEDARKRLDLVVNSLRVLDGLQNDLAQKGIVVNVDLGPIGNAAAAARRDLEKQRDTTFEMPRV